MNDQVEKKAVLVVDDTPTNIQILMEILKDDYRIIAAVNGKRALQFDDITMLALRRNL
jgi:response regulator RpfG family c-di-GMP phosphodiesterase